MGRIYKKGKCVSRDFWGIFFTISRGWLGGIPAGGGGIGGDNGGESDVFRPTERFLDPF